MLEPTTIDLTFKIITAASTLLIGAAASFLAYQQFRLSRSKLRFDLYEKRLAVFKSVRDFASTIALGNEEPDPGAFYRDTIERRFLFEEDVYLYIEEMFKRAQELRGLKEDYKQPHPENERTRLRKEIVKHSNWFFDQTDAMFEVFSKDLAIKTLRYKKEKNPKKRKEKGRLNARN